MHVRACVLNVCACLFVRSCRAHVLSNLVRADHLFVFSYFVFYVVFVLYFCVVFFLSLSSKCFFFIFILFFSSLVYSFISFHFFLIIIFWFLADDLVISLYPVKLVFRNGAYLFDLEWTLRDLLVDLYMKSPGMFNFFLLLLLVCLSCMSVGGGVCVFVSVRACGCVVGMGSARFVSGFIHEITWYV